MALVVLVVAARDGDETGVVVGNDGIGKLERVIAPKGTDEDAVDVGRHGTTAEETAGAQRDEEVLGFARVGRQRHGNALDGNADAAVEQGPADGGRVVRRHAQAGSGKDDGGERPAVVVERQARGDLRGQSGAEDPVELRVLRGVLRVDGADLDAVVADGETNRVIRRRGGGAQNNGDGSYVCGAEKTGEDVGVDTVDGQSVGSTKAVVGDHIRSMTHKLLPLGWCVHDAGEGHRVLSFETLRQFLGII